MAELDTGRVKPPKQSRSRRTLERIVRASLDILEADGPEALTVQAIVERAGSSVGSFYARFAGKEELVAYLGERVWQDALDRWSEALASTDWSDFDLRQIAEGSVGLLVDAHRSRSVSLRALDRAGGGDEAFRAFRSHLLDGIGHLLLQRSDDIDHLRPALAVRVALAAVLGVIDAADSIDAQGLDRDTIVRECRDILLGYLTPSAPAHDSGDVDFFDIWG